MTDQFPQISMEELRERSKKLYEDIDWDDPIQITAFGPEWPGSILPGLEPWVDCVSQDLQVPKGMVALALLSGISVAVRRRLVVQVKERWIEPFNLYTMTVALPGETKTPTLKRVLGPLVEREAKLQEAVADEVAAWDHEHKVRKRRLDHYVNRLATCEDPSDEAALQRFFEKARDAMIEHERLRVVRPRLFMEDATPEAANKVMAAQRGVMAVMSSEGGFVQNIMGRYSKSTNLNGVLKSWDGVESMMIDRVSDGGDGGVVVPSPYLTIGLTVQPRVLEVMGGSEDVTGMGLSARFLFCVPDSKIGERLTDPRVDWTGVLTWAAVEEEIDRLLGGVDSLAPFVIHVEHEAGATFRSMRENWERRRRPNQDLAQIVDWSNKLGSHVARVAGAICLLRVVVTGVGPWMIIEEDLHRAWEFAEWQIKNAAAAYKVMGATSGGTGQHLSMVLSALKEVVSVGGKLVSHADLRKRLKGTLSTDELHNVMLIAERRRWVQTQNTIGGSFKHSTYIINPRIVSL